MKKRGIISLFAAAVMTVATGWLYSCKDYDDEMYTELKGQLIDQNTSLSDAIQIQKENLESLKAQLEQSKQECQDKIHELTLKLDEYMTKEEANQKFDKLIKEIADLKAKDEALQNKINEINGVLQQHGDDIQKLFDLTAKCEQNNKVLNDKVNEMNGALNGVVDKANQNAGRIEVLEQMLDSLKGQGCLDLNARIDSLAKETADMKVEIAAVNDSVNKKFEEAKKYTDEAVAIVKKELTDSLNLKMSDLTEAYKAADAVLAGRIDALVGELNTLKDAVNALDTKFTGILNQRVTSVVLNGAYSPVVGYFALPTGLKSNILAAYYGTADYDGEFPTISSQNYIRQQQRFTEREAELLGFASVEKTTWEGSDCLVGGKGNAGTLYVTVNPSSADLSGARFKLVNSLGEDAYATLEPLQKSNHKLNFGYTRAGAQNGFYEAQATISAAQVQGAKLRVDFNALKDVVKDILSPADGVDMSKVVSTVYTQINDIADANAVEATWKDALGMHSTYSDYGLAAVSVKPVSYGFMKDYNLQTFWGMDQANQLLDDLFGKIKNNMPVFGFDELEIPKIDTIQLQELTEDMKAKFKVVVEKNVDTTLVISHTMADTTIFVEGQNVVIENKKVTIYDQKDPSKVIGEAVIDRMEIPIDGKHVTIKGQTITISHRLQIPLRFELDLSDEVEELYNQLNKPMADVNVMLKDLKRFLENDLQKLLDQLNGIEDNLNASVDNIRQEIGKYLDKLNNKLCSIVNSVNDRIQPAMFVKTNNDFAVLSGVSNSPTQLSSSFYLVPTSYTAEIIAPAYKKFVAVTDVVKGGKSAKAGDAECVSVLKEANNGNASLNTVFAGSQMSIQVNNLKAGYVYEFTYSALDFHGTIANTKCYIVVK